MATPSSMTTDQADIWSAVLDMYAAFDSGDTTRIDSHIRDDATLWDGSHRDLIRNRSELNAVRAARPRPSEPVMPLQASDPLIDIWGNVALVRHWLIVRDHLGSVVERIRNTSVWLNDHGTWQIAHNHEDVYEE